MSVIKIIKPNILGIPIGTILTFTSFFWTKKTDGSNLWDSIGVYNYQLADGSLHVISKKQLDNQNDIYCNVVITSFNSEFIMEGEDLWRVFIIDNNFLPNLEQDSNKNYVKAELFKPYKLRVNDITNFKGKINEVRFKTLQDAQEYCNKHLKR